MSTYAYAELTRERVNSSPEPPSTPSRPGVSVFADALAALVPAEILAVHAAIVGFLVVDNGDKGKAIQDSSNVGLIAFYALIGLSVILYLFARKPKQPKNRGDWKSWDWIRALIPGMAFVAWTMIQPLSLFDLVVKDNLDTAARSIIALLVAVLLGALSAWFADRANKAEPSTQSS